MGDHSSRILLMVKMICNAIEYLKALSVGCGVAKIISCVIRYSRWDKGGQVFRA